MATAHYITISQPPRKITAAVKWALCIGGPLGIFPWLFLGLFLFTPTVTLIQYLHASNTRTVMVRTIGTVTTVDDTPGQHFGQSTPGIPIFYNYTFAYTARDGNIYTTKGVSDDRKPKPGDTVTVTYNRNNPGLNPTARLGTPKPGEAQFWDSRLGISWALVLLGLGSLLLGSGIVQGRRRIRLLERGVIARGRTITVYITEDSNHDNRYAHFDTVLFLAKNGRLYNITEGHTVAIPEGTSEFDEEEVGMKVNVLYDPDDPTNATVLTDEDNDLTYRLDDEGRVQNKPGSGIKSTFIPLLVMTEMGLYLIVLVIHLLR